ncbi:MAG: trypco2 family protein [Candidatus Electrothrix sp.]
MSEEMSDKLELAAMIKALRSQLVEAQQEGEGEEIRFTIEDVELELQVTAEKQASGGISAKFYVLTSKLDGSKKDTVTQKLKLKLKAGKADGSPIKVSDHGQRPD